MEILWNKGFLRNKSQRKVLGEIEPSCKKITSRVPQGLVLEPLHFVIYINDFEVRVICMKFKRIFKKRGENNEIDRVCGTGKYVTEER